MDARRILCDSPPTHETGSEPKGPAVTSLDGTRSEECAARSRRAHHHSSLYRLLLLETGSEPLNAVSGGLSGPTSLLRLR